MDLLPSITFWFLLPSDEFFLLAAPDAPLLLVQQKKIKFKIVADILGKIYIEEEKTSAILKKYIFYPGGKKHNKKGILVSIVPARAEEVRGEIDEGEMEREGAGCDAQDGNQNYYN